MTEWKESAWKVGKRDAEEKKGNETKKINGIVNQHGPTLSQLL